MALPGRFFYLSIQNSNISSVNSITVNSSATINGIATLVITGPGDYLFHHVSSGVWRVNELPRPEEPLATIKRIPFASTVWDAGATKNQIKILQTGSPSSGEIGPHELVVAGSGIIVVSGDVRVVVGLVIVIVIAIALSSIIIPSIIPTFLFFNLIFTLLVVIICKIIHPYSLDCFLK